MNNPITKPSAAEILKHLTASLDISPILVDAGVSEEQLHSSRELAKVQDELESDFQFAREQSKQAIKRTADQLEMLVQIAGNSENPRAFEVLALFMKSVVEANDQLIGMHKKARPDKTRQSGGGQPHLQQNNLFMGTTDEIDKIISPKKTINPLPRGADDDDC